MSDRIAELESDLRIADNMTQDLDEKLHHAEQRIAELEAENEVGKQAYSDLLVNSMREIRAAEAALKRVRERDLRLIEEWRSSDCTDISIAADELAAALKEEGK